jgi:hypothetical protein
MCSLAASLSVQACITRGLAFRVDCSRQGRERTERWCGGISASKCAQVAGNTHVCCPCSYNHKHGIFTQAGG